MPGVTCPTCGSEYNGRAICSHCGTIVGVDLKINQMRGDAYSFISRQRSRLPKRMEMHHVVWLCAIVPLTILPPILSLLYACLVLRKGDAPKVAIDWQWLAIISIMNIVLSTIIWSKFNFAVGEIMSALSNLLSHYATWLAKFLKLQAPSIEPKLYPV